MTRNSVSPETIARLASELAAVPVGPDKATRQAAAFEPVMALIASLRGLPLKEVEPVVLFTVEEDRR